MVIGRLFLSTSDCSCPVWPTTEQQRHRVDRPGSPAGVETVTSMRVSAYRIANPLGVALECHFTSGRWPTAERPWQAVWRLHVRSFVESISVVAALRNEDAMNDRSSQYESSLRWGHAHGPGTSSRCPDRVPQTRGSDRTRATAVHRPGRCFRSRTLFASTGSRRLLARRLVASCIRHLRSFRRSRQRRI